MTEVDFSGKYLNTENARDGDIIEIIGEGDYVQIEDKFKGGKKPVFNLPIKNGTKDLIYSPSQLAGKIFVKSWGRDTKNWIGKKFMIVILNDTGKDRIIPKPIIENKL